MLLIFCVEESIVPLVKKLNLSEFILCEFHWISHKLRTISSEIIDWTVHHRRSDSSYYICLKDRNFNQSFEPEIIEPSKLTVNQITRSTFKVECESLGITFKEPNWILISEYS